MTQLIRRAAHRLSLLFGPGTGTRRAGAHTTPRPAAVRRPPARCTRPALPPHRSPYCRHLPLDGTENRLVRPYLAAHERTHDDPHERDRQAHRRLALVLAADFGIDLDRHLIGAGKVAV